MALFSFKTRDPNRDRQTDASRLQHLAETIASAIDQITREQSGLNARYSRVAADAAFSLQALENSSSKKLGSQVDELTRSMSRSRARLRALEDQLVFMQQMQQQLESFTKKTATDSEV